MPRGKFFFKYLANRIVKIKLNKKDKTRVAYPSTIMIEVTNHCNLHCITCPREYDFGKQMNKGYMDINKLKGIIDEAWPYLDSVGLTGLGETYLYKDLEEAVDYIKGKSKGIIVSISINAMVKNTAEITSRLVNKVDTIQISMDGVGDVYNEVRKNGNFDIFKENVSKIVEICKGSDTDVMMNMVVLGENYEQMSDVVRFNHEMGIKYLNFSPINLVALTDIDRSYYGLFHTDELKEELDKAIAEAKKYSELEFTYGNFRRACDIEPCEYSWNYFYITWDGFVVPCCAKPFPKEKHFGNVFTEGLLPVLNSEDFREFRRIQLSGQVPDFCDKCFC